MDESPTGCATGARGNQRCAAGIEQPPQRRPLPRAGGGEHACGVDEVRHQGPIRAKLTWAVLAAGSVQAMALRRQVPV